MGFDIQPDGHYAVVGIDEDEHIVLRQEGVSLPRLIRLAWEYRPRILATDNIFELANDESLLRKVLSMLPDETEVVQVTKDPRGGFTDLRALAALAGVKIEGKPSPLRTAYIAAVLAKRGYGARIAFTEEKTKIIISRGRHGSAGGMSQARYQRGVKASILRATRIVKKLLDKHGFDYDLVFRKSGYGLESAVFIVYAPRHKLEGVIKRFRGRDIRVEIRPVYTGRITFETLRETETPRKHLIVGVDPGIVTAVAAVDLQGRPVFIYSKKGLDRAEIIDIIKKHGDAVMIATDVTPPPESVKKLAASLGVPLYTPPYPLSVDEKQELVAQVQQLLNNQKLNSHERDALAAALRAYREHASKLRQVESIALKYPAELSIENLKANVIRGLTIAEALEAEIERLLIEKQPKPVRQVRHPNNRLEEKSVNENEHAQLAEQLEAAKARLRVLEARLRECTERAKMLENEIRLLKLEAREYYKDKIVEYENRLIILQNELEKLRKKIDELEREKTAIVKYLVEVSLGSRIVIPMVKNLARKTLLKLKENKLFKMRRIIYVAEPTPIDQNTSHLIEELHPVAFLALQEHVEILESLLAPLGIPVLAVRKEDVVTLGDSAIVPSHIVEEAYLMYIEKLAEREQSEECEQRVLDINDLKKLIESYRRTRFEMFNDDNIISTE